MIMNLKPSDIYLGVIDFFSVLLPGGMLTYFLAGVFYVRVFGEGKIFSEPATGFVEWTAFLLVAYIVGNLVFAAASFLDLTYDKVLRKIFQPKYDLSYKTARRLQWKHFDTDEKLKELRIKNELSEEDYNEILKNPQREIFNAFKWSQHFLLFKKPEALAEIQRIEADSKFFRSLVVAFLIIAVLLFWQLKIIAAIVFIVFSGLCYYRYGELRFKSTQKAYQLVITANHLEFDKRSEETRFEAAKTETEKTATAVSMEKSKQKIVKQELSEDFLKRNNEIISFVTRGFNKNFSRVTIVSGESDELYAGKNELWYCLQGVGILNISFGNKTTQSRVIPNGIFPVEEESKIYFVNEGQMPIEMLVLEN